MAKKVYDLLSINDAASRQMRLVGREETDDSYTVNVDMGQARLRGQLLALIDQGLQFRNCIFTTHGGEGVIWFGDSWIDTETWYKEFYHRQFHRLFPFSDTKLYFAGCNVAEGPLGWKFLEAASRSLVGHNGGVAIGWTSVGFGSPWSGHVRHLWGDTRQVAVLPGGESLLFYENWNLITDGTYPVRPV
jgi:hypothetical protein